MLYGFIILLLFVIAILSFTRTYNTGITSFEQALGYCAVFVCFAFIIFIQEVIL